MRRPHRFRLLAALAMATVLLSACSMFEQVPMSLEAPETGVVVETDDRPEGRRKARLKATVKWRKCGQRFQCGKVRVPVDYAKRRGEKLDLALIRLPAPKNANRLGSLIVNPGGPGGSGVDFVRHGAIESVPAEVRARFDIVGFDPRGVARSRGLDCGDAEQRFLSRNFMPSTAAGLDDVLSAASSLADACAQRHADLLPHMATTNVARDMDAIRRAVGDRKLTYLGFSYGGTIGLSYAEQFPDKVRALVLDGPVDPAIDGLQRAHDQAEILEATLRKFFEVCPTEQLCRGYTRKLSLRRFDALLERLDRKPLPAYSPRGARSLHSAEALVATAGLLKDRGTGWPVLAAAIGMAERGDGSLLLGVAESTMAQAEGDAAWLSPLLAVNCLDVQPPDPGQYASAVDDLTRKSRHFGPLMLLLHSPCAYWQVPPQRSPAAVTGKGIPAAVVIGTTGDPTTPYIWAEQVAKHLDGATLLTRDGDGHTAFGKRNVCTDRSVSRYLVDGVLPAKGLSCG